MHSNTSKISRARVQIYTILILIQYLKERLKKKKLKYRLQILISYNRILRKRLQILGLHFNTTLKLQQAYINRYRSFIFFFLFLSFLEYNKENKIPERQEQLKKSRLSKP